MTARRTVRLLQSGLLLAALSLAGCSPPPADEAPPLRQLRRELAQQLKRQEPSFILEDLREEGGGRYAGAGEANVGGMVYNFRIEGDVQGRWMHYTATGTSAVGEGQVFSGLMPLPVPTFRESHSELMQWLRAAAFVVQGLAVVWAVLGRFGLRRSYSPRVERVLVVVAAINLGFALLWGYEFVTTWRAG
ncbi:MAG TPA: hypothetical protein VFW33_07100 [Gemmataceae bacterium]|nr:hypothetical protein [Gemmataceae bacterium]